MPYHTPKKHPLYALSFLLEEREQELQKLNAARVSVLEVCWLPAFIKVHGHTTKLCVHSCTCPIHDVNLACVHRVTEQTVDSFPLSHTGPNPTVIDFRLLTSHSFQPLAGAIAWSGGASEQPRQ